MWLETTNEESILWDQKRLKRHSGPPAARAWVDSFRSTVSTDQCFEQKQLPTPTPTSIYSLLDTRVSRRQCQLKRCSVYTEVCFERCSSFAEGMLCFDSAFPSLSQRDGHTASLPSRCISSLYTNFNLKGLDAWEYTFAKVLLKCLWGVPPLPQCLFSPAVVQSSSPSPLFICPPSLHPLSVCPRGVEAH